MARSRRDAAEITKERHLEWPNEHRRTVVLRAHGPHRAGDGLRASQSDGPVVLDLPDGADVDLVPLHRHRRAGLRPLAEMPQGRQHERRRAGLLGGDRRDRAGREGDPGRLLGRLGDHQLHAQPQARADAGADLLRHRLPAGQGVRPQAHRRLQEIRHRLPLALHVRRSEPGVPRDAAGDVLRRHVHASETSSATSTRSSISSRRTRRRTRRTTRRRSPARRSS